MKDLILKGCGTALVTPFTPDGDVDYEAYAAHLDRQVAGGVDFFVALATTGETPTLTRDEKIELLKVTHEHCAGLPVVVGCGTNSFNATLDNMELLEPYGVDAWLVVVPYYNKPTQTGIYEYFRAVAAATDLPVVMYNVPGRTGANMIPDTCIRLAKECDNIVATKEAAGLYGQVNELTCKAPEGFSVLSGDDDITFALMALGGQGVISVASNIAPVEVSEMVHALAKDDVATARALHHRLSPLFKACFNESNPIPAKAALAQMGIMSNAVRLPLSVASEATEDLMRRVLADLWKK